MFDILRKEAECSFCIYPFNKPKTLPCLHSFCLDCLNKYAAIRRQQGHTTFDCPECLTTFQLPDDDKFDAFQTAFHKNRLLNILALEKTSTGQEKNCDNCDENVAASSYCFECQAFLCEACLDKHNAIKITRAHRQASLQNLQTADIEALIQRPVLCDKQYHEREPLEYYCEDCRLCICHKCALVEHKKHSILEIPRVAEQHKRQIIQDVEQMKSRVTECKEKIEKSKTNFEGVEQQIEEARHKTQATVEELIRDLKEHEAKIMRELDEVHQTQQQAHLAELENFEQSLAQLNSAVEYAEAIMRRNMGPEVVQTKEAITQRCVGLVTNQKITSHKSVRVSLITNDELCQTVRQSALGRVVVSLTDPLRSLAEGKGLQEAECGERAEFTVITKDAEGQQCYYKRDQVTVHIQTAAQEEAEVKIEDKKDGTYHVTYLTQRHGQHHVMINVNGQPLTGSPWDVHVTLHRYQAISSFGSKGTGKGQLMI